MQCLLRLASVRLRFPPCVDGTARNSGRPVGLLRPPRRSTLLDPPGRSSHVGDATRPEVSPTHRGPAPLRERRRNPAILSRLRHGRIRKRAVDGRPADAQHPSDGSNVVFPGGLHHLGDPQLVGGPHSGPSAYTASRPGSCQTGHGSFPDQVAFKFCEGAKDVEDQLAAGRAGVDALSQAGEGDPTRLEVMDSPPAGGARNGRGGPAATPPPCRRTEAGRASR